MKHSLLLIPLLCLSFTAQAHDFSTSVLTLEPGIDADQLTWQWRFTEHDLEALVGSSDPNAALPALPHWLTLSTDVAGAGAGGAAGSNGAAGATCKLEPSGETYRGVYAGERTITFTGTAPCAYRPNLKHTPHLIHHRLPDHKILRPEGAALTL